jgi:hypothetical protein
MWAIATIDYANAEYVREERERKERGESVEVLQQREYNLPVSEPLATLVERMRRPLPVAVDQVLALFLPPEGAEDFLYLVREYLPDFEKDILKTKGEIDRIERFVEHFSGLYFPLYEFLESYDQLATVPAEFRPFSSYDYGEIPNSGDTSTIVIAYVLEDPWSGHTDRAAFAEAAGAFLPVKLMKLIPEDGFEISTLDALKGTPFEPVAFWGLVIKQDTGNPWFDAGSIDDTGAEYQVEWNKPTVDGLTKEYHEFEEWQGKWAEFSRWFESALTKNTYDLVRLLRKERRDTQDGEDEDKGEDGGYNPEFDPDQGRLFNLEPYAAHLAGTAEPAGTAGYP